MVSDCEDGKINFIVTKSLSRFARNTTDCLELVRKLTDLGVYIYFEKENLNTQSMESELMLSILSSLAESESVSISENNKWSAQRRFQNGTFKVSYPPYGYDNVDGQMVVNEEQAETVRWMFDAVLAGKGTCRIASELNERGVPTKKGGSWTASTVRGLLSNEKFTGDILFQKTYTDSRFNRHTNYGEKDMYYMENHHPAIVSRKTFEAVAAVISQRGKEKGVTKGSKYQNRYPFSGRIICSECGGTFKRRIHYSTHQKYIAWCCSRHIEQKESCSMQFIRNDALEAAFATMMNKLVYGHRKILRPLLDSLRRVDDADSYHRVEELEDRIEAAIERGQVLAGLMAKGYLEPVLFNKERNELAIELGHLQGQKDILIPMLLKQISMYSDIYIRLQSKFYFSDLTKMLIDYFSIFILFHDTYEDVLVDADLFFKRNLDQSVSYQLMNILMSCKLDEWMLNNNILLEKRKNLLSTEKLAPLPDFSIVDDINYCIIRFSNTLINLGFEDFWNNNKDRIEFYINFFVAKEWKFVMNKMLFTRFSNYIQKTIPNVSFTELALKDIAEVIKMIKEVQDE